MAKRVSKPEGKPANLTEETAGRETRTLRRREKGQ